MPSTRQLSVAICLLALAAGTALLALLALPNAWRQAYPSAASTTIPRREVTSVGSGLTGFTIHESSRGPSPASVIPDPLPSEIVVIGDSLTVGAAPYLAALADALALRIRVDARVGRSTNEGLARLAHLESADDAVVVLALGTNDRDSARYSDAVDVARTAAGTARAIVWLTIVRPNGRPLTNASLAVAAANAGTPPLRLVVWEAYVAAHPEWLASDGVHLTATGYRARALAIIAAATGWPVPLLESRLAYIAPHPVRLDGEVGPPVKIASNNTTPSSTISPTISTTLPPPVPGN